MQLFEKISNKQDHREKLMKRKTKKIQVNKIRGECFNILMRFKGLLGKALKNYDPKTPGKYRRNGQTLKHSQPSKIKLNKKYINSRTQILTSISSSS